MDCGPTCLRMVARHYGRNISLQRLRKISGINREGVSLLGISDAAEKIGFRSIGVQVSSSSLRSIDLPVILHWNKKHFVVLYKIKGKHFYIADPSRGSMRLDSASFTENWISSAENEKHKGIALMLAPTPDFFVDDEEEIKGMDFSYLAGYLTRYKKLILQLFLGLGIGSLMQLILPFLTQSVVDVGINTRNISFVYVVLIAQSMLLLGRMGVDFIRSWILLHISTRVNISILTDFLVKLMKLPMAFFDTKMTGDIMQRMNDQHRIESFLTGPTLNILFSFFNLFIFGIVLSFYNAGILAIFLVSTVLYGLWIIFFLSKRRTLDYKRFEISSKNQSAVVQLIAGMQEIKLNNCEKQKRWEWERIQARLFQFNVKSLALGQYQMAGSFFINEGKNILITFLVAKSVINGQLTLGAMMAVQYIIGQLNSPIEQLITFVQQFQDAKISLERLNEIRVMKDEEPVEQQFLHELPVNRGIKFDNISFTYPGAGNEPILTDLNIDIPEGKTTAIVGMSGSGKTTILKLLLRFYEPDKGEIKVGNNALSQISFGYWRGHCGVVMQDGFIFSDSIARNIAVGDEYPDVAKLRHAINIANIGGFIDSLAMGVETKIGAEGNGISQGQRQRILIARAVYKNPDYLFFDEATNALDANNERVIMENMESFFRGRTVIVVAHRLSTVRNADNIIVMEKGNIIEQGSHEELSARRGAYYKLVKNQLEMGS